MVGQRFGHLLVLRRVVVGTKGTWECRCDCGNLKNVIGGALRRRTVKSCGCNWSRLDGLDFIGCKFGRLTVLEELSKHPYRSHQQMIRCFRAVCNCGTEVPFVTAYQLRYGWLKSCGCLKREVLRAKAMTHGKTHSPEYRSWASASDRCRNKNLRNFDDYGGRGISVCTRWKGKNGFINFLRDMGPRPTPQHSLDRKNNNGNYTPKNCKWSTREEQARNKRSSINLSGYGRTLPGSRWAKLLGVSYYVFAQAAKAGRTIEEVCAFFKLPSPSL